MSENVYLAPPATESASAVRQHFSGSAVIAALKQLLTPQLPSLHTTPQPYSATAAHLELQTLQPLDARSPNCLTVEAKVVLRTYDPGPALETLASLAARMPLPPQTVDGVVFRRVTHGGLQSRTRMFYGRRQLECEWLLELVVDLTDSEFSPVAPEPPCPAPPAVPPRQLESIVAAELAEKLQREPDRTIFRGELPAGKDGVSVRFVRFMNAADPLDAATAVLALDVRERRRDDLLTTLGDIAARLPKYDWDQEDFTLLAMKWQDTTLTPLREAGATKQQATLLLELAIIAKNSSARGS